MRLKLTATKSTINKIRVTQRDMERSLVGVTLRDRMPYDELHKKTKSDMFKMDLGKPCRKNVSY